MGVNGAMLSFFKKIISKVSNFEFDCYSNLINYISSGEALPSALNEDEEKKYIGMLGTENCEFAKKKLIEHNLRLVVYVAKKFENSMVEMEDLISIGSIGLIKAINSFNGDKNIKIATYASRCIQNEILMYLRKISKQKNFVSIDDPLNIDSEGNELLITDLISPDDDIPEVDVEKENERKLLWNIINSLNKREKEIMLMRFGLDGSPEKTQKEVADDLGISQSYISRLEKKIFKQIKKEMLKLA